MRVTLTCHRFPSAAKDSRYARVHWSHHLSQARPGDEELLRCLRDLPGLLAFDTRYFRKVINHLDELEVMFLRASKGIINLSEDHDERNKLNSSIDLLELFSSRVDWGGSYTSGPRAWIYYNALWWKDRDTAHMVLAWLEVSCRVS